MKWLLLITFPTICLGATQVEELYKDISGFGIPTKEEQAMKKEDASPTYGEITDEGVRRLMSELQPKKTDVFYDLGSGVGRMVVKVYLDTPVRKAVGIELSETRVKHAEDVRNLLYKQKKTTLGKELDFKHGNFLEVPLQDASIIYMASTCFSDSLLKNIMDKLARECKKGLCLISLRELPKDPRFIFKRSLNLPMTWSKDTMANIYELQ